MHTLKARYSGFTLVEMLIVVAIISLLAVIIYPYLNEARIKSRDAKRIAHIEQLNLAIKLYLEANGVFPCPHTGFASDRYINDQSHCLASELVPTYLPEIPVDPVWGDNGEATRDDYQYVYVTSESSYYLRAEFEGDPLEPTANYPSGTTCQTSGLPVCAWRGEDCVYYSDPPDCSNLWLHKGGSHQ